MLPQHRRYLINEALKSRVFIIFGGAFEPVFFLLLACVIVQQLLP
jgi:hypothetical protein